MSEPVYCHQLYEHELGYRRGVPGGAGRFIFVPKFVVNYFPQHDPNILNDHKYLRFTPFQGGLPVLVQYTWHNDSLVGEGSRNERRIYLNDELDQYGEFIPGNFLLIVKATGHERTYYFKTVNPQQDQYDSISEVFNRYRRRQGGHHAIIPAEEIGLLEELEGSQFDPYRSTIPTFLQEELFSRSIWLPREERDTSTSITLVSDSGFTDVVKDLYQYRCSFSGDRNLLRYGDIVNLDAAHIIPKSHGGGDNPQNGLSLIKDLHWAFDRGFITVSTNFRIEVHEQIEACEYVGDVDGREINLPSDPQAYPSQEALEYHNDNIFGRFLRS